MIVRNRWRFCDYEIQESEDDQLYWAGWLEGPDIGILSITTGSALVESCDVLRMSAWKERDCAEEKNWEDVHKRLSLLPEWNRTRYYIKLNHFGGGALRDCKTHKPVQGEVAELIMPQLRLENLDPWSHLTCLNEPDKGDEVKRLTMAEEACPKCGSEETYDCGCQPRMDVAVAYCLDCRTFWCEECGYVFPSEEAAKECPHWRLCEECWIENDYLDPGDFIEDICPTCEHFAGFDIECQLGDLSKCQKKSGYMCPYLFSDNSSECPKIVAFLQDQP